MEKTALAEARVEYEDFTSDMVWVKFESTNTQVNPAPRTTFSARQL